MANIERIKKVVDAIEANADTRLRFDMAHWLAMTPETKDESNLCGTSMCFAGWAVHLEGLQLDPDHSWRAMDLNTLELTNTMNYSYVFDENGLSRSIEAWAKDYFEFSESEVFDIFYAEDRDINTVKDLKEQIEQVIGMKLW